MQARFILFFALFFILSQPAFSASKTNIIYLIGDGMGVAYTSAYRYYQDDSAATSAQKSAQRKVKPSIFDEMLTGSS